MTKTLTIDGRSITIAPIKIRQLPAFVRAVEPVAKALAHGDVLAAMAQHAEALIEAVCIGAGVERAWLEEREVDVLVELAAEVIEVNADFFVQRILPKIETASGAISSLSLPAASTPSSVQATD
jgi:DNA replicative helicase MCM subunit Mcm2 (Cdc46/Mcm family)